MQANAVTALFRARGRLRPALHLAAGACLLAGASFAQASQVFTSGHFDLELAFHDGAWDPHWHEHGTGNEHELDDVIMRGLFTGGGTFNNTFPRPACGCWNFSGAAVGDPIFIFPSSFPGSELPYLGIGADEVDFGLFQDDEITLTFKGLASAPAGGHFSLHFSTTTPLAYFSSFDASLTQENNTLTIGVGSHNHLNWTFTQPGLYGLIFEAGGTLVDGSQTSSGDFVAWVQVIPEPATLSLLGLAGLGLLRRRN